MDDLAERLARCGAVVAAIERLGAMLPTAGRAQRSYLGDRLRGLVTEAPAGAIGPDLLAQVRQVAGFDGGLRDSIGTYLPRRAEPALAKVFLPLAGGFPASPGFLWRLALTLEP